MDAAASGDFELECSSVAEYSGFWQAAEIRY